jgi:glycogen synthase
MKRKYIDGFNILFSKKELSTINKKFHACKAEHIVYCSFENRYATSGGLGSVTKALLPYLDIKIKEKFPSSKTAGVILLTPFYPNIDKFNDPLGNYLMPVTNMVVPYGGKNIPVEIYKYNWRYQIPINGQKKIGTIKEYYLKADGFFEAKNPINDPYIYDLENTARNNDFQIDDSAFYCKMAPLVVYQLKYRKNIIFHLQEWQTSLISLTSIMAMLKNRLYDKIAIQNCRSIQTLHNTFDSFQSPGYFLEHLRKIFKPRDEDKIYNLAFRHVLNKTFSLYSIGLSFLQKGKISTVSNIFSKEITSDLINTHHFAPHLQNTLKEKGGVKGINNGAFLQIPEKIQIILDDTSPKNKFKEFKYKQRKELLKKLSTYKTKNTFGELTYQGSTVSNIPDFVSICFMSGRLDFSQKGYDILLRVIELLHKNKNENIKFVLSPMPVRQMDLNLFKKVACACRGTVLVIAERMTDGYFELQSGSTFGIMPSIFEPFGAAIEYMANGTCVIARKTGGLIDQIKDGHDGLLYHEGNEHYDGLNIDLFYNLRNDIRKSFSRSDWVKDMVHALKMKLEEAHYLYKNDQDTYFQIIMNAFKKSKEFNWTKSANDYFSIFS